MAFNQEYKLADYFSVIGLDDQLKCIDPTTEDKMIEKVEVIVMQDSYTNLTYNSQVEKWIDLDGTNSIFLRIIYGHHRPITDINFYRIKYQSGSHNKMRLPASMDIEPVPIKQYGDPDAEKKFKKTKKVNPEGDTRKDMIFFYGDYDLTPYLEQNQGSQQDTNLCFCFSRKRKNLPISDIEIVQGIMGPGGPDDIDFNLPPLSKQVNYRLGNSLKNRLLCYKQRNYLKRKFEAKVLDRYPFEGRDRLYYEYPFSLSQFCFPSGIQFTSQRSLPSYFSFILTDAQGQHIYGTALIFDEILSPELKNKLKQNYIYNVENIYSQKAICILSHYAFMNSFKEILKQLYRIHLSSSAIPIERYIVNIMDEIPVPDKGNLLVQHEIGNQTIPFFRQIDQYPPYASKYDIEYLFRALDAEQVIDIFMALLLEKKVLLMSEHKALLTHATIALISFLFPLCWKHVLIPILPRNMTDVLDAPVPFLIGIEPFIIKEDQFEIPNEVYRVDLDNGSISLRDPQPKLPSKIYKTLKTRLQKATQGIVRPDPILEQVDLAFEQRQYDPEEQNEFYLDEYEIRDAFLEFMSSLMSGYTKFLNAPDAQKDIFFDSKDFFDFKKFRVAKEATSNTTLIYKLTETTLFANFIEARSFGKSDQDDQIMWFDDQLTLKRSRKFPQIVRPFKEKKAVKTMAPCEEGLEPNQVYKHQTFPKFDLSLFYVPRTIENYNQDTGYLVKSIITNEQLIKMHDTEWARYLTEIIYLLWFQIFCTTLPMYSNYSKELIFFAKRLLEYTQRKLSPMKDAEMIYRRLFEACGTCRLQDEIQELFLDMKKHKIDPDKVTFGTYYQAFLISKKHNTNQGSGKSSSSTNLRYPVLPKKESYLRYTPEDFQQKLKEFEVKQNFEEEKQNAFGHHKNSFSSLNMARSESDFAAGETETQIESIRTSQVKLSQILENSIYLEIESLCQQCDKPLKEEEIISGFSKNLSSYVIKCPICKENYVPKFIVYSEYKTDFLKGREGASIQMLSPVTLYKEYINLIEHKGEQVVLRDNFLKEHKTVFWNIILYFKIMRLPIFMLDLDYSQLHIKVNVSQIKKFLPLEKKKVISSLTKNQSSKLDQEKLRKLEQSPVRQSSISRMASSVVDAFKSSLTKNNKGGDRDSEFGDNQSVNNDNDHQSEKKSLSNYFMKKKDGSHKSGSGAGSFVTSLSDLERIEKIMTQAQYANKSIVKYFSKNLEEFRREMQYSKEIILSELVTQGIPEQMSKQVSVNMNPNPLTKNFSQWSKNNQQVTAEAIINDSINSSRHGSSFNFAQRGNSDAQSQGGRLSNLSATRSNIQMPITLENKMNSVQGLPPQISSLPKKVNSDMPSRNEKHAKNLQNISGQNFYKPPKDPKEAQLMLQNQRIFQNESQQQQQSLSQSSSAKISIQEQQNFNSASYGSMTQSSPYHQQKQPVARQGTFNQQNNTNNYKI